MDEPLPPPDGDAEEGPQAPSLIRGGMDGVTPVQAIAEALRINAEALRRIDQNQKRIAESVEKGEKATNVVTSTRALNETFRGLSEIQRGLLDAVVRQRGGGRGFGFAMLAVAVLAGILGFLVYDRLTSGDHVAREVYEAAREGALGASKEAGLLRGREGEALAREQRLRDENAAAERGRLEALHGKESAERRVRELESELEAKASQLKNYLAVKDMADSAGSLQLQNMQLQREIDDLRQRLASSERERESAYEMFLKHRIEEKQGDPEAIKKAARDMGVIPPPAKEAEPGALGARDKRKVRVQLNRLLGQAHGQEIYEILDFAGIGPKGTLLDVRVGRYLNQQMLNSLVCKELDIVCLRDKDAVELRFREGASTSTRPPIETLPFEKGGYSVLVAEVRLEPWLADVARNATVEPDGRLTWKSTSP